MIFITLGTQKIQFDRDISLKELALKFYNSFEYRGNFSLVNIELWDLDNNKCIFNHGIMAPYIESKELLYIDLKDTQVQKGKTYEIRLSGNKGIPFHRDSKIYPYFTAQNDKTIGDTTMIKA